MSKKILKISPIGGVAQIGGNMTYIESGNESFVIDCGILFPNDDLFNLNYLTPDFGAFKESYNPEYLIITHGHEDHIGAIFVFLKYFPQIKIYAPKFAKELIINKSDRYKMDVHVNLMDEDFEMKIGDLRLNPIRVNHSIPDTFGIYLQHLKEKLGVFFISDFKVDLNNFCEPEFDFKKLKSLSNKNTKNILLADSTNISNPGSTPSELDVYNEMKELIKDMDGRVFITCFASNIFRMNSFIKIAKETKRAFVPVGRAMNNYLQVAISQGLVDMTQEEFDRLELVEPTMEKQIVMLSGCQGDYRGALRRVTSNEDRSYKLNESDTIIFSSKTIPGNEKKVWSIINDLCRKRINVITAKDYLTHVSGHPGKKDLAMVYNEFQPTDIVPIHGEILFLHKHTDFINESFPHINAHLTYNDSVISVDENLEVGITKMEEISPLIFHGNNIIIERNKISERRKLAQLGQVTVSVSIASLAKREPSFKVSTLGIPNLEGDNFQIEVTNFLKAINTNTLEKEQENLRIFTRRYFQELLGYRPISTVHFV